MLTCLSKHAPIKTIKIKQKPNPSLTSEIKKRITYRNKLHKKAKKSGSKEQWDEFRKLRKEIKIAIKEAECTYFNKEIKEHEGNTSAMWKTIRRALPARSKQHILYTKNTTVLANEFNKFFTSVGENAATKATAMACLHGLPNLDIPFMTTVQSHDDDIFDFKPVSQSDVKKAVLSISSNKAPGYDKLPISIVKDCLQDILTPLTTIINESFSSSVFPQAWKTGEIIPLPKNGDHEVPDNNRPVTLLPSLSKVNERIAMLQFNEYLTRKNLLTSHQSGNRKLHSTETLSLLVTDHIYQAMDSKKITAMVLIDLSKAFDSLCHSILIKKLQSLGVSIKTLEWFKSYLSNREQRTRVANVLSDPLTVTHGVPQGSILGPMLFTLYINDLHKSVKFSNVESYVDDTKIFLSFETKDLQSCLQQIRHDLRQVASWCCANHLLINPDKTQFMLFGVSQLITKLPPITIPFLGSELKPKDSAKDLGIILDTNLTFTEHINALSSSLLGSLCQINRVKHLFSKEIMMIIINSLIFSKLYYCSTVWSGTFRYNIDKLQLLQNFAARILTNTRKYEHISPVLQQLGWLSVEDTLCLRDVILVYKCMNNLVPDYLATKITARSTIHRYNTRRKDDININKHRTTTAQRNFFYRAIKSWNALSLKTRTSKSIEIFKNNAKKELCTYKQ